MDIEKALAQLREDPHLLEYLHCTMVDNVLWFNKATSIQGTGAESFDTYWCTRKGSIIQVERQHGDDSEYFHVIKKEDLGEKINWSPHPFDQDYEI